MSERRKQEYAALRATIRERGTTRVLIFWLGIVAWAALIVAIAAAVPIPAATLVPLLVLAATFECVYGLHIGVERVGRYLQVFHEDAWETTAMDYGRRFPGGGPDAIFSPLFALAALINFLPVLLVGPTSAEWIPLGLAHLVFLVRIGQARHKSARQRAEDLERFRTLAGPEHATAPSTAPDVPRP